MKDRDIEKGDQNGDQDRISFDAHPEASQPTRLTRNRHFASELAIFQGLVGIHHLKYGGDDQYESEDETKDKTKKKTKRGPQIPNPLLAIFWPSKTIKQRMRNRGLYNRAVTQDLKNRTMYTISRYVISGLFILQVLVAATLTALSAYHTTSTVVLTILGAINTVIAGLLAWLTGQGMPTRFRRARDQYREIVRACEAMERRFAQIDNYNWEEGKRPDPVAERDKLNKMFDAARKDQEANYPETTRSPQAEKDRDASEELSKWKQKKKEQESLIASLTKEINDLKSQVKQD